MKRPLSSSLVLLTVSVLATGCATTRQGAPLGDAAEESLSLADDSITGPTSTLSIAQTGMHGRYRRLPVSLEWDYQTMTGTVANQSTRLELAEGDDTRVWGTFAGLATDLTEDGTWLHGRVGPCAFVLKRDGDALSGSRSCGGSVEQDFSVAFPARLFERSLGERAALMTLALLNTRTPAGVPSAAVSSFQSDHRDLATVRSN
ncbi:hypothetical protein MYSTI_01108 [Myxococcus stipitatus DSM 14675]|uniref:Lipoprotein n=1 Tax=Myxococcus stipitatus (strain DSM 14675 / JCM 12634 / Mx s8) TaxID=1278073 RepID=L7U4J8_MYXSD|nr:hypothetical protein [Myxococcus stipitatus]AGC42457.1 hypothetical protein MYSTI_01108 [Myxococcus stipitatus DSM 14675]